METGPEAYKKDPDLEKLKEELDKNSDWVIRDDQGVFEKNLEQRGWTGEDLESMVKRTERELIFKRTEIKILEAKRDRYVSAREALKEKEGGQQ